MKKIIVAAGLMIAGLYVQAQESDSLENRIVFSRTEVEASFPGGIKAWSEYLKKNLKASTPINNGAPIGTYQVIIRFIVSKDGSISDAVAETMHGFGMEQEVIRIIKNGPKWIPAMQNNRNVNAYRRQPVTFVVQEDDIRILSKINLKPGAENIVHVAVNKVKSDDTELEVSNGNGTVKSSGENTFIIIPSKPGQVIVDIYVNKNGKRKKRASACFNAG